MNESHFTEASINVVAEYNNITNGSSLCIPISYRSTFNLNIPSHQVFRLYIKLILEWRKKYGKYIMISNNCQHFELDIVDITSEEYVV